MAKTLFLSPAGAAQYPHLVKPDTEGQYATNKFTTKLVMTPEAAAPLMKQIDAVAEGHKVGKKCKVPYKKEVRKVGDDKTEETGNIVFSATSKFPPLLIDAKNYPINRKKVGEDFVVGSGSTIRIAGEIYSYDKGVSLQMKQVQILNLVDTQKSMFEASDEGTFDGSDYEDEDSSVGAFTDKDAKVDMGI